MSSSMEKQAPRRILTPGERDRFNQELNRLEADKRGDVEGVPRRMQGFLMNRDDKNTRLMDQQGRRIQKVLADGDPGEITAGDRVELERREKELTERLAKRMVPQTAMRMKPGSVEFRKAVNQVAQQEMSADFNNDATDWKNIRRRLHPQDPDASNLETIRPQ